MCDIVDEVRTPRTKLRYAICGDAVVGKQSTHVKVAAQAATTYQQESVQSARRARTARRLLPESSRLVIDEYTRRGSGPLRLLVVGTKQQRAQTVRSQRRERRFDIGGAMERQGYK